MPVVVALALLGLGAGVGARVRAWAAGRAYLRPGDAPRLESAPTWPLPACTLLAPACWWALAAHGRPALGLVVAALSWLLVALAVVDLDVHRLPDRLTLPAYPALALALGGVALTTGAAAPLGRSALAAVVVLGAGSLLWLAAPRHGLGLGDVKLAGLLAAVLAQIGWSEVLLGLWLGLLLGAVAGVALVLRGRAGRHDHLALGPALAAGALLTLAVA